MQASHRLLTIALALTLLAPWATAQTRITLDVQQSFGPMAWLYSYRGKELVEVDSSRLSPDGLYQFTLPNDAPQGQYRLTVGRTGIIELLVHGEQRIALRSVVFALADSLRVVQSEENRVFVSYMRMLRAHEHKRRLLDQLLQLYPPDSPFAQALAHERNDALKQLSQSAQNLCAGRPELLATSYINLNAKPHTSWDGVNLNVPALLGLPVWADALWRFVEGLQDDQLDKEQQDNLYAQQAAELLGRPMADTVRARLTNALCMFFAESDYYTTIETLLQKGGAHAAAIANSPEQMQRIAQERPLSIGAKAPDFEFTTIDGRRLKLSKTNGSHKLLLFWSAWCPHCVDMLPALRQLYAQYQPKGFEIVAISVDTEDPQLPAFVRGNQLTWLNSTFTTKNEELLAKRYNIDGTPKMLLLDDKLRIASKPINPTQLRNKLKQILGE